MDGAGTIGFLGYGNMGAAILEGLIEAGRHTGKHTVVYDPSPARRAAAEAVGAELAETPAELAADCDTLVLAVKPQVMDEALQTFEGQPRMPRRAISIAAGISIRTIQARLGDAVHVIRVMPNTPALVSAGAAGIALGPGCDGTDAEVARAMFESIGIAVMVEERDMDAVTALSGSGPAYFFRLVECLVKAAVAEGLDAATASRLAGQTLLGAGKLLKASGETPEVLRQRVTSKGGTTEAALRSFEQDGLEAMVRAAVSAAAARSRELGA